MARSKRPGLIAAMALFLAISLPRSSYAQQPLLATGTWTGTEYFTTYCYQGQTLVGESGGSYEQASLTLRFTDLTFGTWMSLSGFPSSNDFYGGSSTGFRYSTRSKLSDKQILATIMKAPSTGFSM
jgi:hypothetical protein